MSKQNSFFLNFCVLWLGHFLVDLMIGIWPVYKTMAELDLAKAGLIGGGCALAGEGFQMFFGPLSDKGYRKLLIFGGIVATSSSIFFVYTRDYYLLSFLYLLTCLGSGAFHPSASSLSSDLGTTRKGLFVSIFASGGSLGMAFSQVIFAQAYLRLESYVGWLILPAICLALFAFLNKSISSTGTGGVLYKPKVQINVKVFADFFRRKVLRLLYFSQVCNATLMWGTMFLLPDILKERGYDSWVTFGGGHMFFILGSAAMVIPAGYLADKYSTKLVIFVATVISLVLFYAFIFIPNLPSEILLPVLFFTGAALGVVNPVSVAFGTHLEPQQKGMVSAFLMGLVWCVSEGIGQCGGGLLTTCFDNDAPAKALAVLGCLFPLALGIVARLPQEADIEQKQIEYA
jgi:MFS transporter, FSR family, fosmidomycin resistance protein